MFGFIMRNQSFSIPTILIFSFLILPLAGCQTAVPKPVVSPVAVPAVTPFSDDNLEQRVGILETQIKSAQPTLKKVEAIEMHFKTLSLELDRINSTYNIAETPIEVAETKIAPTPVQLQKPEIKKPEPKKSEPQKSSANDNDFSVTSVRIGEQSGNITRIVLDTTKAAEINYDLDNNESLLVIDVPKAKWFATKSQTLPKSPLIKGFQSSSDEAGSRLVINLKEKARVVATSRLAPTGKSGNRVYIDIAPAK